MDLGFCLEDDSLFEISKDERRKLTVQRNCPSEYNLKISHPLWFYGSVSEKGKTSKDCMDVKFCADHAYSMRRYDEALHYYRRCQVMLKCIGSAKWRDVNEGATRCLLHLGRLQEAMQGANRMTCAAQNIDQLTASLHLQLDIRHKMADDVIAEGRLLRKLILLHPHVARLWMQLGELFEMTTSELQSSLSSDKRTYHHRTADIRMNGDGDIYVSSGADCLSSASEVANFGMIVGESHSTTGNDVFVNDSGTERVLGEHLSEQQEGGRPSCGRSQDTSYSCGHDGEVTFKTHQWESADASSQSDHVFHILTCYTMARLLLQITQKTVTSFAKQQNERLQIELERRIEQLSLPQKVSQHCLKFVQKTLNKLDAELDLKTSDIGDITHIASLSQWTDDSKEEDITSMFDQRWFSWEHNCISR